MQLTYRGVRYESNNSQNSIPLPAVDLKYRGACYRAGQVSQTKVLNAILKYRGAAYGQVPVTAQPTAQPSIAPTVPAAQMLTYRGVQYQTNPVDQTASAPVADLKYRGAAYRSRQNAGVQALNAILTYRGAAYQITAAQKAPAPVAVNAALSYRGLDYQVKPATEDGAVAAPTSTVEEKARLLTLNHHRVTKTRQQTVLARAAAEVGMPNTGSFWNHIQGKIHPSFWETYDRSHAAFS